MRRLAVVGVAVTVLVGGACRDTSEPLVPTATLPQATTTTNPYAVPAAIDEAYVNRVLARLDQSFGEVTRIVLRERAVSQEAVDRLSALYRGEFLELRVASFESDLQKNFSTYRENPGDRKTVASRLINVSPSCIFVEVARDYSAVASSPAAAGSTEWVAITHTAEAGSLDHNPTRWIYIYDGFMKSRTEPMDPCAGPS